MFVDKNEMKKNRCNKKLKKRKMGDRNKRKKDNQNRK